MPVVVENRSSPRPPVDFLRSWACWKNAASGPPAGAAEIIHTEYMWGPCVLRSVRQGASLQRSAALLLRACVACESILAKTPRIAGIAPTSHADSSHDEFLLRYVKTGLDLFHRGWSVRHPTAQSCESDAVREPSPMQSHLGLETQIRTNLWNVSTTVRPGSGDKTTAISAALRSSGFRLIEAGLPHKLSIETLIHVLQLASKAGADLADVRRFETAASVLGSAAKYEERLRSVDDPQGTHQQSKAQATVVYYCSRMEAAWKEGNHTLAHYMLQNITGQCTCLLRVSEFERSPNAVQESENERLALLPARDRELLASKLLHIGKSLLTGGSRSKETTSEETKAPEAVKWLQKSFALAEQLDDTVIAGSAQLKRCILRNLGAFFALLKPGGLRTITHPTARAYLLSSTQDPENLSRAEASIKELLTSVDASGDNASSEYEEIRWWMLAVLKRRKARDEALLEEESVTKYVYLPLRFRLTQQTQPSFTAFSKNSEHQANNSTALVITVLQQCLQRALDVPHGPGFPFVDRLILAMIFHCSRVDHTRAMHDLKAVFQIVQTAEFDLPKVPATSCLTLLWQFGERQYGVRRYSEAADWFLQGTHPIFRSIADTSSSKSYRKAALCHIQQEEYAKASAIIRCCPGDDAPTHYVMLLAAVKQGLEDEAIQATKNMVNASHFDRKMLLMATRLAHESDLKGLLLTVLQELSKAVRGREGLEGDIDAIAVLRCLIRLTVDLIADPATRKGTLIDALIGHFEQAKILVRAACVEKRATIVIKDISWLWRTAYNCAIQGCSEWDNAEDKVPRLFDLSRELLEAHCEVALIEVDEDSYLCIVYASFAAISGREVACRLRDWTQLPQIVERASRSEPLPADTFEAIADMLWAERDCPVDVLLSALEVYPVDERSWLMATSYNTGIECFQYVDNIGIFPECILFMHTQTPVISVSLLDEAKRWFEASTVICRFVPDGETRAKKILETYTNLLNRYAS
ncbi:hypothetical protein EW146_g7196 [Bondarzewia mesenterica]|uniref:Protein ZIP4 homolog n=1 Tax=Bondarzewia mesenterica TaxID=1095465 RepID=A0A4S4LN98_9AGAM|nr:hypothetical protein EW146_g7196 [Bondarzewia mesenterica]